MTNSSLKENRKIVTTGSIALDTLSKYPGSLKPFFQQKHDEFSVSLLINEVLKRRGGTAANIAYTLALLGEHPILLGSVGQEDREYIKLLQKLGVNTNYIHFSETAMTANFSVLTDTENNQFATFYPGAMSDSASLSLLTWKGQEAFVIISAHDPKMMHQQICEATQQKLDFCFDIGQQVHNTSPELVREGVENARILIANNHEMHSLSEKIGVSLQDIVARVPICITTLGSNGALIEGQDVPESLQIPVVKVRSVVDPTGAGDAWRAGFLYAYTRGRSLRTAGRMGAVAAAYVVEQAGGQEHFFTRADFQRRYSESFGERLEF